MGEDRINELTVVAFHIDVVGVGSLDYSLQFMATLLVLISGVQEVLIHYIYFRYLKMI